MHRTGPGSSVPVAKKGEKGSWRATVRTCLRHCLCEKHTRSVVQHRASHREQCCGHPPLRVLQYLCRGLAHGRPICASAQSSGTEHDSLLLWVHLVVQLYGLHCLSCRQDPRLQLCVGHVTSNTLQRNLVSRLYRRRADDLGGTLVHSPRTRLMHFSRIAFKLHHGAIINCDMTTSGWASRSGLCSASQMLGMTTLCRSTSDQYVACAAKPT